MPDVELLAHPPALYVGSSIEPCRDFLQPCVRIARATAKLNNHVKHVITAAASTVASRRFYGLYDKVVKKLVEFVLPISGDDELPSPFSELAIMFFLAESLLHLFIFRIERRCGSAAGGPASVLAGKTDRCSRLMA